MSKRHGGDQKLPRAIWAHVIENAPPLALRILLTAESMTTSAPPDYRGIRPEFWDEAIEAMADRFTRDRRSVEMALIQLEEWGCIERRYPDRKHGRGGIKLRPENFCRIPKPQRAKYGTGEYARGARRIGGEAQAESGWAQ